MGSSALHRGVDHIAVHCYDLDATVQFYTEGLEFKFVREWSAPDVGVHRCIFLDAGDDRLIELFDAPSAAPGGNPRGQPTTVKTVGPSPMTIEVGFVYGLNGEVIEFIRRP